MNENKEEKVFIDLEKVPLESEIQEKKKKKKFIIANCFLFVFLISLGFILGILFNNVLHPVNDFDQNKTFGEISAILENYYLYKDNYDDFATELEDNAFYGMTSFGDDPYTTYMSKQEIEEFAESINMDYVGIGIVYFLQDEYGVVERVIINSPAEEAGILAGDIMTAVDGVSIKGLDTATIKQMVVGVEGTEVVISIIRDGQAMDLTVTRGVVDNSVYACSIDDYVLMDIYSFGEETGKECITYLDQYTDYNKIIIDIRDNTGGYQTAVSEIAGLFIGNSEVYLKQTDSNGNEIEALTSCSKTYDNFDKIVILMNENTASAAEVFAICLREKLDNVTLVGTYTYGKGVIQSTHYLANGGALKFTSYAWSSPNGVSINGVGVEPDVEVYQDDVYYAMYINMEDDEKYEYDSVSEVVELSEKCLSFLGYDVDRTDGYFSVKFGETLNSFKVDNNLNDDQVLDKQAYDAIVASTLSKIYSGDSDKQMDAAIKLIKE